MESAAKSSVTTRAWWVYVGLGLALMVVDFANPHAAGSPSWVIRYPVDVVVNESAVVALVVGIWRWRPAHALPWCLMALSQAVYTAGDVVFYWQSDVSHVNRLPGPADPFYLGRRAVHVLEAGMNA